MAETSQTSLPWRATLYDGYAAGLALNAEAFFELAIEPPCKAMAAELALVPCGPAKEDFARWDRLRDAQLELHRSLAMALGGMWERHFRRHLEHSLAILVSSSAAKEAANAKWDRLCSLFRECRGFDLAALPGYDELALLYNVTSVVRHGNGPRAKELFSVHPELFAHEPIKDWFSYLTLGGEPDYSIHRLDIPFERLRAFKDAVVAFWEAIARLQQFSSDLE